MNELHVLGTLVMAAIPLVVRPVCTQMAWLDVLTCRASHAGSELSLVYFWLGDAW